MAWKPYNENEYRKPSKINCLVWVAILALAYFLTKLANEHWPAGWDGNTYDFWDDIFIFSAGCLLLGFLVRFLIYILLSKRYDEWQASCRRLDANWKAWANRHLVCLANYSELPSQVTARNWVNHRAQLEQFHEQALPIDSLSPNSTLESVLKRVLEPLSTELSVIATAYPIRCHLLINSADIQNLAPRFQTVLQQIMGVNTLPIQIEIHPVESGFKVFAPIFQHSLKEAHLFVIAQFGQTKHVSDALSSYLLILGEYHEYNSILPGKAKLYRPQLITQEQTVTELDKFHTTLEQAKGTMPLIQSASANSHSQSLFGYLANADSSPTEWNELSAYTGKLGTLGDFFTLGLMANMAAVNPQQLLLANYSPDNTYLAYIELIKAVQ